MKTIGLIGGTSWVSTQQYYKIINETVNKKLGDAHSARIILYSVDFEEDILKNMDDWKKLTDVLIDISKKLEYFGADFLLLCANTMHRNADDIQKSINIPILHIAEVTGLKIVEKGFKKVGLLGTKTTMEQDFYKKKLLEQFGIETIIPDEDERQIVHDVIIDELTHEKINDSSKHKYIQIIDNLVSKGAQGIILGCTEIPLLINQNDVKVPVFDTTKIHSQAAAEYAIMQIRSR